MAPTHTQQRRHSSRLPASALAASSMLVMLVLLAPQQASAARLLHSADALALPCAVTGAGPGPVWMNASATCLKFWPAPAAPIALPDDTPTTKYGQIMVQTAMMDDVVSVFLDRQGKQYGVSASAHPPQNALELEQIWTLIIVQARVDPASGNVTAFTPVLYVPYSTLMATMENTVFEGVLTNTEPRPVGPNATSYFRWTFGSTITVTDPTYKYGTLLQGTFDNLFRAVKDSKGQCQPALCDDPTFQSEACQYYERFFGTSGNAVTLNWDPNMHAPVDSELVPMFPATHRQYMSSWIKLWQLLKPSQFVKPLGVVDFFGHGNPMGVPQNFQGVFKPASPVVFC